MPEAWGTIVIKSLSTIDTKLADGTDFDAAIRELCSFSGIAPDEIKAFELRVEKSRLQDAYLALYIDHSDWLRFTEMFHQNSGKTQYYSNLKDEFETHQLCSINGEGRRLIFTFEEESDELERLETNDANSNQEQLVNPNKWARSIPDKVKSTFPEVLTGLDLGEGVSGKSLFRKLAIALEEQESVDELIPKIFQIEDIQLVDNEEDDLIFYLFEALNGPVSVDELARIFQTCIEAGYDVNGIRAYEPVIVSMVSTAYNDIVYKSSSDEHADVLFKTRLKIIELFLANGANPNYVADGHQYYETDILAADDVDFTIDENTTQAYWNILADMEPRDIPSELLDILLPYCSKSLIRYALTIHQLEDGLISIGDELSIQDIDKRFLAYISE